MSRVLSLVVYLLAIIVAISLIACLGMWLMHLSMMGR
jgi:hypothetical protein